MKTEELETYFMNEHNSDGEKLLYNLKGVTSTVKGSKIRITFKNSRFDSV